MVSTVQHYFGSDLIWRTGRQRVEILHKKFGKISSGWEIIKKLSIPGLHSRPIAVFTVHH